MKIFLLVLFLLLMGLGGFLLISPTNIDDGRGSVVLGPQGVKEEVLPEKLEEPLALEKTAVAAESAKQPPPSSLRTAPM